MLDLVWNPDEVERPGRGRIDPRVIVFHGPAVVVLACRREDRLAGGVARETIAAPLGHDPSGERGVIGLADEQEATRTTSDDHAVECTSLSSARA
jgi:hypothetical protein